MAKRELSETEKALRLEQLVERKMLAAAMRLGSPTARAAVAQRVNLRLSSEAMRAARTVPFVSGLAPAHSFDPRNQETCDPGLDVGGEGGA